jgi:ATP-binding cassette, subfamily B, bacterial
MSSSTIRREAPATTKYTLEIYRGPQKVSVRAGIKRLLPLMAEEKGAIAAGFAGLLCTSGATLVAPLMIAYTIDTYIRTRNTQGLARYSLFLACIYLFGVAASYVQFRTMGSVGRRVLFRLRNQLFLKLQELPLAFFNQNKSGDLISRINNDTDKLNQFVSQGLMQFIGGLFQIAGTGIFLVALNIRLGTVALLPAMAVVLITRTTAPWLKRRNLQSLQTLGGMSSEVQEGLNNFKVIVAFNRADYFRQKFDAANRKNFSASVSAGIANNTFMPLYTLASNLGQLVVLCYGIYLISTGYVSLGLLVGFLIYVNNFYNPLRQLAAIWSSFQLAAAALDRVSEVLSLESNMPVLAVTPVASDAVLEFRNVDFHYPGGQEVLRHINFELERGKAYALVGPTGGGKTTTASLMARLYDPSSGEVLLEGRDIRSYSPEERADKIGFIPQEPFLFSGTVRDNILYGNRAYWEFSNEHLTEVLAEAGLSKLLSRFPQGLDTAVATGSHTISLGQKQIIAFMRAVLRSPELLILDEATANIDTVTEQLLQEILDQLPARTTKVIIAHRLNTIDNVDQIFFVNSGEITLAGSMEHAVEMLLHHKRES